jgi:hypothetical protein
MKREHKLLKWSALRSDFQRVQPLTAPAEPVAAIKAFTPLTLIGSTHLAPFCVKQPSVVRF